MPRQVSGNAGRTVAVWLTPAAEQQLNELVRALEIPDRSKAVREAIRLMHESLMQ